MCYSLDVVYGSTAWECTSILFERQGQALHPQPLFSSPSLFLLPVAGEMDPGGASSASVLTSTTESVFEYPITYTRTSVTKSTVTSARNTGVITSTAVLTE